ncbi:MAG: 6,7-dimethyl-8-ribityllumazine synthase [Candidatus Marinimicrobia bacterium]|nr:6,7-dimethyl-8-ribityllumazine synthase [Candidatus Neomarinimicrobiota bacterium]
MVKVYEGKLKADGLKVAILTSRFNDLVTKELNGGAIDCLKRHGMKEEDIHIYWVPGAFELPATAKKIVATGEYDGVICIGAVIRGATPHFDMVANEATKGIAQVAMQSEIPVIFGVLTTDSIEQALERAGTKAGNKGWDAALTAVEMMNLHKLIK